MVVIAIHVNNYRSCLQQRLTNKNIKKNLSGLRSYVDHRCIALLY